MIKRFFLILVIFSGIILGITEAKALSVSPLKQLITLSPGAKDFLVTITVKNEEGREIDYRLITLGAKQDEQGLVAFGDKNNPAEDWVIPQEEQVKILPNEEKEVSFKINIPITALPGAYILGLAVQPIFFLEDKNVSLAPQVASILDLQISGIVTELMEVNFSNLPKVVISKNWPINLIFSNLSNVEISTAGNLIIRNWFNKEVFKKEINFSQIFLPNTLKKYNDNIKIDNKFLIPGLYSMETTFSYGLTDQKTTIINYVWYLPIYFLVILFIITISVAYKIYAKIKKQ